MAEGEQKPDIKPEDAATTIQLVVKDQQGGELHFKVKAHTKFEKIFNAYATKKSIGVETMKFLFDGARLRPTQTPAEVGLENDDCIEAMVEQLGGGG
jgi:small ubiquitin-related modifier